jgi:hypothetical protein
MPPATVIAYVAQATEPEIAAPVRVEQKTTKPAAKQAKAKQGAAEATSDANRAPIPNNSSDATAKKTGTAGSKSAKTSKAAKAAPAASPDGSGDDSDGDAATDASNSADTDAPANTTDVPLPVRKPKAIGCKCRCPLSGWRIPVDPLSCAPHKKPQARNEKPFDEYFQHDRVCTYRRPPSA